MLQPRFIDSPDPGQKQRFTVGLPAMALACREVHRDVRSIYFGKNAFIFGSSVMSARAIAAFERFCGSAAKDVKKIKVNHVLCRSTPSLKLRFTVESAVDGIKILAGPELKNIVGDIDGWRLMCERLMCGAKGSLELFYICFCSIIDLALQRQKDSQTLGEHTTALGFLKAYEEVVHERATIRSDVDKVNHIACHPGIPTPAGFIKLQCSRCNGCIFERRAATSTDEAAQQTEDEWFPFGEPLEDLDE